MRKVPLSLQRYGSAVASILLALLLRIGFQPCLDTRVPFATCLFATLFTVWYAGK